MDTIDRIRLFLKAQGVTKKEFLEKIGKSRSYLDKVGDITTGVLCDIAEAYPQVNIKWLATGEGNMLNEEQVVAQEGIPYYETENFECGRPGGFGGALEVSNPDGYFQFPWVKNDGSVFCVRAHGNSMLNFDDPVHSINHGAMVALKRSQVGVIQWGEVYALATADGYIIKQLQPSEKEGCVRCVSFNGATYKPFDIPVSEIYDYALVVGVANINVW